MKLYMYVLIVITISFWLTSCNDTNNYWDSSNQRAVATQNNWYDYIGKYKEWIATVEKNWKWWFIDESGKEITEIIYDITLDFNNWLWEIMLNDKFWKVNSTWEVVIEPIYDSIINYLDGNYFVEKDGKNFIIDNKWNFVRDAIENK